MIWIGVDAHRQLHQALALSEAEPVGERRLPNALAAPGFVGLALLSENLARISRHVANLNRVVCRIYEQNRRSITFFSRLGLRPAGRRQCYYHPGRSW